MDGKNWEKIDPLNVPVWNGKNEDGSFSLKTDDMLLAIFVGVESDVGPNHSNLYTFKKEDNSLVSVWGSQILDTRFKNLEKGEEVKVIYLGDAKGEKSGRDYHNYDVYHVLPTIEE